MIDTLGTDSLDGQDGLFNDAMESLGVDQEKLFLGLVLTYRGDRHESQVVSPLQLASAIYAAGAAPTLLPKLRLLAQSRHLDVVNRLRAQEVWGLLEDFANGRELVHLPRVLSDEDLDAMSYMFDEDRFDRSIAELLQDGEVAESSP